MTLLALGNGAPDVFSAIAAVRNMKAGDAGLAIGALTGMIRITWVSTMHSIWGLTLINYDHIYNIVI